MTIPSTLAKNQKNEALGPFTPKDNVGDDDLAKHTRTGNADGDNLEAPMQYNNDDEPRVQSNAMNQCRPLGRTQNKRDNGKYPRPK